MDVTRPPAYRDIDMTMKESWAPLALDLQVFSLKFASSAVSFNIASLAGRHSINIY